MRICLSHGVGLDTGWDEGMLLFKERVEAGTGAECFLLPWTHPGKRPPDVRSPMLGFGSMRKWLHDALMDAAHVALRYTTEPFILPPADMYVGHSGGSIQIAGSTTKPRVLLGSPVQLVRNLRLTAFMVGGPVLNVMNHRDPLAAVIDFGKNVITYKPGLPATLNPVTAHQGYWKTKRVAELTIDWFKRHVEG
jgi:hypothetical protein